jgi:hypothetical protein
LIKVVTCVFVLAADGAGGAGGAGGEILRGAPFLRQPGVGGVARSVIRQLRCPGAAIHVTCCARPITVRLHDPVVFSVDVAFSDLFQEKTTSTEKATSKAKVADGIRSSAGSARNPAYRPASATSPTS